MAAEKWYQTIWFTVVLTLFLLLVVGPIVLKAFFFYIGWLFDLPMKTTDFWPVWSFTW